MKQWGYFLIIFFPSLFCVIIVGFIIRFVKGDDVEQIGRWIAKYVFSDILKEEKREGRPPRWLFKDINLTSQEKILHRVWLASPLLFVGILNGAMVIFWHIFLLEVSSVCDVNDPSQDCFEVVVWDLPKQDPINCSSAAVQNGTTYVLCYKIVFNLGVAIGASYGVFKLSMSAFSLGSSALLMIKKTKNLQASRIVISLLFYFIMIIPVVLKVTPLGVTILSDNLIVLFQLVITALNLTLFLWGIPWNELIELNAENNNRNDTGLENPVVATDDN